MKLVISGYYGFGNIGDEAILQGAIQGLKEIDRSLEITVLSREPQKTAAEHNVTAVSRFSTWQVFRAIQNCDVLISGGGALFQDTTSKRGIIYYLSLIQIALWLRKRVVVFAQGFGPIERPSMRVLSVKILQKVHLVLLRDLEAVNRMKEMGIVRPPIHVTGDPACILEIPSREKTQRILEKEGILHGGPLIAICPRRPPGMISAERLKHIRTAIAQMADTFIQKHHAKIIFVNFQPRTDVEEATQILNAMSCPADVILREYSAEELMGLLGEMTVVVGIRLHALVFSTLVGTPFIGLSYDPKVANFSSSVHQKYFDLEKMASADLISAVEEIIAHSAEIRSQLLESREILKQGARRNFEYLKGFLYSPEPVSNR